MKDMPVACPNFCTIKTLFLQMSTKYPARKLGFPRVFAVGYSYVAQFGDISGV